MARTLALLAFLTVGVGCRNTGGDRDVGTAPRGFDTPRTLRGAPAPDDPSLSIEEQQRRGRARYAVSDQGETQDWRQRAFNPPDRYGPTGR